jgi:hypothetical protein
MPASVYAVHQQVSRGNGQPVHIDPGAGWNSMAGFDASLQQTLEQNDAGLRKLPGTALVNQATGQTVYMPPQHPAEVEDLMRSLVAYLNTADENSPDPLIKMAVIHHRFESIHPFYDGKGFLEKQKIGKSNFYINMDLYKLLKGERTPNQKAPPIITLQGGHR